MNPIDLRSDTVTRPSAAMRKAMAQAEVGDDVYGEDPTVQRLQELAAALVGHEAALFVPSGTMANQAAIRVLGSPGEVMLAGEGAHVLRYEGGAAAARWGVQIETLGSGGFFDASEVRAALVPDDAHYARIAAVAVENTHNISGGRVWPRETLDEVVRCARDHGLGLHLDGARLFNAALASKVEASELATPFDTVAFCLSKGLGAPVGSLVCASADRIRELHRARKMLGGGMRQAGVLAAAGLYALEHNVARLADDHANAKQLAEGLRKLGFELGGAPQTNIVMFRVPESSYARGTVALSRALRQRGVLIDPIDRERLRAVTHLDVGPTDVERALRHIEQLVDASA